MLLLAILALLAVLAARANAAPDLDPDTELAGDTEPAFDPVPLPAPLSLPDLPGLTAPAGIPVPAVVPGGVPVSVAAPAPPIATVVAAAYRASGLDSGRDPAHAWRWRARLASLVPLINVRGGRDATWRDIADPTVGYVSVFSVSATWHLERLVFDASELRIWALEASRQRARHRIAAVTIHTYYIWLRARLAATHEPGWALRADEAAADLDALTDGWFSQACAKVSGSR